MLHIFPWTRKLEVRVVHFTANKNTWFLFRLGHLTMLGGPTPYPKFIIPLSPSPSEVGDSIVAVERNIKSAICNFSRTVTPRFDRRNGAALAGPAYQQNRLVLHRH